MSGPDDLTAALARLEDLRGEALDLLGRPPEAGPGAPSRPEAPEAPRPGSPALADLRAGTEAIVALGRQLGAHLDALAAATGGAPLADHERAVLQAEIARRDEALRRIGELVAGVPPMTPAASAPEAGSRAELDLDDLVARIEALQRTVEGHPPGT